MNARTPSDALQQAPGGLRSEDRTGLALPPVAFDSPLQGASDASEALPTPALAWTVAQLVALTTGRAPSQRNAARTTPGEVQPGSSTDKVLHFLQAQPKRWFRLSQIAVGTGCRDKTVSWALHGLKARGLVRAGTLGKATNSRYLRYSIVPD